MPLIKCDRFNFNYHSFDPGLECTTVSWVYVGQTCTPVRFTLQAFELEAVTSRQLSAPRVALDSTSPTFSFPTNTFTATEEVLYVRVLGVNAGGAICNLSLYEFYDFAVLRNGIIKWILLESVRPDLIDSVLLGLVPPKN